jgi:hypothetical protein
VETILKVQLPDEAMFDERVEKYLSFMQQANKFNYLVFEIVKFIMLETQKFIVCFH